MRLAILIAVLVAISSCGSGGGYDYGGGDKPTPSNPDDALIAAECGRCHRARSPHINSAGDLRSIQKAASLVREGRMPPDRKLSAATKAKILILAGSTR